MNLDSLAENVAEYPIMPSVSTSVALLAAVASVSASPTVRSFIARSLDSSSTMSTVFKILAILYAVVNFKNLPGVWHIRVFRGTATSLLTIRGNAG
jgi:hypothetical protein